MNVAIVIVNYKTPDMVIDCLKSIFDDQNDGLNLRIFIGDADSQDGSVEKIDQYIQDQNLPETTVFDIGVNGGFAFGNNYICHHYVNKLPDVDYVHFLNPDTYIRKGAITHLVKALTDNPDLGMVGSRLENEDESLRAYGFRFPTPWREFFGGANFSLFNKLCPKASVAIPNLVTSQEVDWVTGASFMMPKKVLESVGLMDSRYFLYYEEVDLMFRLQKAGYKIWHCADSRVVHLQGAATGVKAGNAKPKPAYWYQSRYKFFHDHYGKTGAFAANFLFLLGDAFCRVHRLARGKPTNATPGLWRDMLTHGFELPEAKARL